MKFSSQGESLIQVLEEQRGRRVTTPMKHNLATKVQQRFQAARFILSTARPDDITIVKVGKDVRFKISEEERAREKPRESTKKVEMTAYFSTDHVNMITPS